MIHLPDYKTHSITLLKSILTSKLKCIDDYSDIDIIIERGIYSKSFKMSTLYMNTKQYVKFLLTTVNSDSNEDLANCVVSIKPDEYTIHFKYNGIHLFSEILKIGITNKIQTGKY